MIARENEDLPKQQSSDVDPGRTRVALLADCIRVMSTSVELLACSKRYV